MIYQRKREHVPRLLIPFMLPKTQAEPRFRLRTCVFKFPSAFHWRLRTPSTDFRIYYNKIRICSYKYFIYSSFVLAALEPNCSCALLPFCYLIFKGHGMRSASSQVNSKCSKFHPVGVCINLPLPRLSIICG